MRVVHECRRSAQEEFRIRWSIDLRVHDLAPQATLPAEPFPTRSREHWKVMKIRHPTGEHVQFTLENHLLLRSNAVDQSDVRWYAKIINVSKHGHHRRY